MFSPTRDQDTPASATFERELDHPYAYAAHHGVASSARSAGVALESSVAV